VRVGVTGSGRTEIIGGLAADARLVDSPPSDLKEGGRVRVQPPSEAKKK
jgi:hypothetical protein